MAYRDHHEESGTGTTPTFTAPSGAQNDDIMIVHLMSQRSGTTVDSVPSGWTLVNDDANPNDFSAYTYWHKKQSGDPGSWQFTLGGSHGAGDDWACTTAAYSGRDGTSPIDEKAANQVSGAGDITSTSITPTVDDCDLVGFGSVDASGQTRTWTVDSPSTERGEWGSTSLQGVLGDYAQSTKAAWTITCDPSGNNQDLTCHVMALKPSSGVDATVLAVAATATAAALVATLSVSSTLLPPAAAATAAAPVGAVAIDKAVAAPAATATAAAPVPTLAIGSTLLPPAASATASAPVATLSVSTVLLPPAAAATAAAPTPSIDIGKTVLAVAATATAAAPAATISTGTTLLPPAAAASAAAPAPTIDVGGSASVTPPAATAAAAAPVPTVAISRTVAAVAATATAAAPVPTIAIDRAVSAVAAAASASAPTPTLSLGSTLLVPVAAAVAVAPAPLVLVGGSVTVLAVAATATASAPAPTFLFLVEVEGVQLMAHLAGALALAAQLQNSTVLAGKEPAVVELPSGIALRS